MRAGSERGFFSMQFSVGRPDLIRAINQRWLINFWKASRTQQQVPSWQAVEAQDLSRVSANLCFMHVEPTEAAPRLRIFAHGPTIGRVYGSADCRGKYLDEVLPPSACHNALSPYYQAVQSGHPVYLVHDVIDRKDRIVHFERLLLPFATDGRVVDRILASFELVSPDGAFESDQLMATLREQPVLRLSTKIAPSAMA